MRGRECHTDQDVGLGLVKEGGELGYFGAQLLSDPAPLDACCPGIVLGEGGSDEGGDDTPAPAGVGKDIAHEMNPGSVELPEFGALNRSDVRTRLVRRIDK